MIEIVNINAESTANPFKGSLLRTAKFSDKRQDSNNTTQKMIFVNVNLNLPIYNRIKRD